MANYLNYEGLEELVAKLKSYTDDKVNSLDLDLFVIVTSLPSTGVANKIYLVPATTTSDNNKYDEYIWLEDSQSWEFFGEAHLDVDVSNLLKNYVSSVSASGTAPLTLSGSISNNVLTLTGSIAASSASADGYMSSTQYTQLANLVDDPLQYATAITIAEIDALFD